MSFNGASYGAGKNFTTLVALGLSTVSIDNATGTVTITLTNGDSASWTFPRPQDGQDGVSITGVDVTADNELKVTLSDGTVLPLVPLPEQDIKISAMEGNGITNNPDGLYVSTTGVQISPDANNAIETKPNGLFVPKTDLANYVEKETGKGLSTNDYDDTEKQQVSDNKDAIDLLNGTAVQTGSVAYQIAEAIGHYLQKDQGAENAGKALVVGADGNVTVGDAGVKVSDDDGNQIETRANGIYVPQTRVIITEEDYEALPDDETGKMNPNVTYLVTD